MKTRYNLFFYAAAFCTVSFSFCMEVSSNITNEYKKLFNLLEKLHITQTNEYKEIVKPLENVDLPKKELKKTCCSLEKLVSACASQGEKTALLDSSLNDQGKRLIHYIARISHRKGIKKTLCPFWNLLLNNNININIQDVEGNTPLHDAFYNYVNINEKTQALWNPRVILFLLHYNANPLIPNTSDTTPENIFAHLTHTEEWLADYQNQMYTSLYQVACIRYK